jgi:membrane protease YdiL (CAAX protease family)
VSPASAAARQSRGGTSFLPRYLVFLFSAQTAYAFYYVHSPSLRANYVLQICLRLALWTLPVISYLALKRKNVLGYLRLSGNIKRGVITGLVVGCALIVLNLLGTLVLHGHTSINLRLGAELYWKAIITVGLSEEVVFRGYLLREFSGRMHFWPANLLQSAAFLAIHVPGWILLHQFAFPGILRLAGYVFLAGAVLGFIWKQTGSLWGCIIAHSVSNFCSFAIH